FKVLDGPIGPVARMAGPVARLNCADSALEAQVHGTQGGCRSRYIVFFVDHGLLRPWLICRVLCGSLAVRVNWERSKQLRIRLSLVAQISRVKARRLQPGAVATRRSGMPLLVTGAALPHFLFC